MHVFVFRFDPRMTDENVHRRQREEGAKVSILSDTNDPFEKTVVFHGEDHTLGNALRYVLMQE